MEKLCSLWSSIFLFVLNATLSRLCYANGQDHRQAYIVYMGGLPNGEFSLNSSHHISMLRQVVPPRFVRKSLVRSYTRSFNAFAAYLTEQERQKLEGFDGVVSGFPCRTLHPQTTRSWDFMGFPETSSRNPTVESNVIVGLIDTGIWPESESFRDDGLGPAPSIWKGVSGQKVKDASFYGFAQGTARGGVPSARIAVYRVCFDSGCYESDVLAAFDDAIADGVDVISISIGGTHATDLYSSTISIGSFHAMERGILAVNSAGNYAKIGIATSSVAPWMLTVAASNIDRRILNKLVHGNTTTILGNAMNAFHLNGDEFALIYGKDATSQCLATSASKCETGCLDSSLVKGKIVLCDGQDGLEETENAGAVGAIVPGEEMDYSFVVPLPAAGLSDQDMNSTRAHINSTKMPKGIISTSEVIWDPTPFYFDILKPDITAPGVEILAAYSPIASPSFNFPDKRSVKYNILSGTSMACPHVAGAAAYVKSFHPDWSPSAIKSALMTTAWEINATKHELAKFAYGARHLYAVKAVNPVMVYEITKDDYIQLVCSLNYDAPSLGLIFGGNVSCPKGVKMTPKDLNYPAMTFSVGDTKYSFTVNFTKTITNIGQANSTYKATIIRNSHLDISIEANNLSFKSTNEQKTFAVTVSDAAFKQKSFMESASLVWSDGSHSVRCPIVLF